MLLTYPTKGTSLKALSLQLNENVFRCLPHTTGQNQNCLRDNRQTQTNILSTFVFAHLYIEDWSFNFCAEIMEFNHILISHDIYAKHYTNSRISYKTQFLLDNDKLQIYCTKNNCCMCL